MTLVGTHTIQSTWKPNPKPCNTGFRTLFSLLFTHQKKIFNREKKIRLNIGFYKYIDTAHGVPIAVKFVCKSEIKKKLLRLAVKKTPSL